jgi:diaminohydroxyphosphoribosylaminopyrimidine deaminase/5-amino-6-(5-phosphoribosylamino)uracil reductase
MQRALSLALRGAGWVNPNPLVGAVIVKEGRIIGEGWHTAFGELHAERHALSRCSEDPRGATLYVSLEPCCHTGKQPPCTEALIASGIAKVVMGAPDPNPQVSGGGIAQLRAAGIEVVEGVLVEECRALNAPFFHYIKTGKPYVTLKYAMTLDGKIATHTGASQWITSREARRRVHFDRQRSAAILVGVGTVLQDNPSLTCRLYEFEDTPSSSSVALPIHNPLRVICDTHLRTPLKASVIQTAREVPTCLATTVTDQTLYQPYLEKGCSLLIAKEKEGHVDLSDVMNQLGKRGIDSVMVEGGAGINWSALNAGIVNKIQAYIAPKLFGGTLAPQPVGGCGVDTPDQAFMCGDFDVTRLGCDVLIESEVS